MRAGLNPFKGLDRPREVWAWGMYDLANQSFTLLIITLLFPIYFREVVAPTEQVGEAVWSGVGSGSLLLVVIISPFLGAYADAHAVRKKLLIGSGVVAGILTCLLAVAVAVPSALVVAAVVFFLANVFYQLGENLLASFLPDIASAGNMGRVSATGWSMGYIGALILLGLTAGAIKIFGLGKSDWRVLFLFAGVWFLLGIIPAACLLRERSDAPKHEGSGRLGVAFARLGETARSASTHRQLMRFFLAFFVYAMGVQAIIYFAGIIASDFGFTENKLVLFVLQLTVTAGIAAVLTGVYQDRLGSKPVIIAFLSLWIATASGMLVLTLMASPPEWLFWIIGNGVGLGLGGIGTASRAVVARFTPRQKAAEFFGFWGTVYKLAGFVGVLSFGQTKAWFGSPAAMALLLCFFIVGLLLFLRVNEGAGIDGARRAERLDNPPV